MSGPDELLADLDAVINSAKAIGQASFVIVMLGRCRTRIAANAALAAENESLRLHRDTFYMDYRMECDAQTKTLHVENAALAARCGELQAAIDELVACKDLKDALEDDLLAPQPWTHEQWRAMADDYERRKPLAWAAARALASQAEGER